MKINGVIIGANIRKYRLFKELTQHYLAKKVGISRKTLISYERGYTTVPINLIDVFVKELNVPLDYLIGNSPIY
jgi:transcriptional regulator with XRE-family HTH domain